MFAIKYPPSASKCHCRSLENHQLSCHRAPIPTCATTSAQPHKIILWQSSKRKVVHANDLRVSRFLETACAVRSVKFGPVQLAERSVREIPPSASTSKYGALANQRGCVGRNPPREEVGQTRPRTDKTASRTRTARSGVKPKKRVKPQIARKSIHHDKAGINTRDQQIPARSAIQGKAR